MRFCSPLKEFRHPAFPRPGLENFPFRPAVLMPLCGSQSFGRMILNWTARYCGPIPIFSCTVRQWNYEMISPLTPSPQCTASSGFLPRILQVTLSLFFSLSFPHLLFTRIPSFLTDLSMRRPFPFFGVLHHLLLFVVVWRS